MNIAAVSIGAIILYLAAASRVAIALFHAPNSAQHVKVQTISLGMLAIILHGAVLYQAIVTSSGLNMGFFNALSLVAWMVAVALLITAIAKPLENLAIILLPLAALSIALERYFPTTRILPDSAPMGLRVHVLLSVIAYSLLTIAAFQALLLAIQDRQLRNKRPVRIIHALPPLQTMETLLFQIIGIGFFLLSLSLISGLMFVEDLFAQHLVHKTVLSIVAWLVFAVLLWGRWHFGWRGRRAIAWTLGGFVALMLAYFGSKVALELILHR
ncbi:MAG: cytochrome c biogenesis protein CcsA [Gammaproteobacteria bacterium]|nr:cytochrome c biogenesis protein CcsA [Gammaproteobacteria bacterium]